METWNNVGTGGAFDVMALVSRPFSAAELSPHSSIAAAAPSVSAHRLLYSLVDQDESSPIHSIVK